MPEIAGGTWWRFDRYELRDGFILPAPQAVLEYYDPWGEYRGQSRAKIAVSPYHSLLELAGQLADIRLAPRLSSGDEDRVLRWCSQHGPLGILLHQTEAVALPARWELVRVWPEQRDVLLPTLYEYVWGNDGWSVRVEHAKPEAVQPQKRTRAAGSIVTGKDVPADWPRAGALIRSLYDSRPRYESLEQTWARFFPSIREGERATYAYPCPLSTEFCGLYAEPLVDFVRSARLLRDAILDIGLEKIVESDVLQDHHMEMDFLYAADEGKRMLSSIISPLRLAVIDGQSQAVEQKWMSPSLLGFFALMALQDLAEHGHVRRCDNCKGFFSSEAYQAKYCSARCRQVYQKRAYRKRRRDHASLVGERRI